jgi:hypothetical protein
MFIGALHWSLIVKSENIWTGLEIFMKSPGRHFGGKIVNFDCISYKEN